jgi:hypothetical protein
MLGDTEVLANLCVPQTELTGAGILEPLLRADSITDVSVTAPDAVWLTMETVCGAPRFVFPTKRRCAGWRSGAGGAWRHADTAIAAVTAISEQPRVAAGPSGPARLAECAGAAGAEQSAGSLTPVCSSGWGNRQTI